MARIAFIQDALYEYFGPMYLSAVLKKGGHQTEIFVLTEDKDVIDSLKKYKPDMIAFSVVSGLHGWALKYALKIKKHFDAPILFGGPHPTFFSQVIEEIPVDIIAIGEGEYSLLELADSIDKGEIDYKINGLWFKKDGKIIRNPNRPLVQDLDNLPFPDRDLYYSKYPFLKTFPTKRFITSRGCPYNCSFCYNHTMKGMFKGMGAYLRRVSPERVIAEVKYAISKYPMKSVRFIDDSFTLDHEWLKKLLILYRREIKHPFSCLVRANELDEEIISLMAKANCTSVAFGVETGSQKMRNLLLHKGLSNDQIINAAKLLRKYKIKFGTYNMIGLPGETIDGAINTMKFNAEIKVDFPNATIFQPYPNTELAQYCIDNGYLDESFNIDSLSSMFQASVLKSEYKDQFTNLEKFFNIGAKYPFTIHLIKKLIKARPNKLYDLIGLVSYGLRSLASFQIGPIAGFKIGMKMLSTMKKSEN